MHEQKASVLGSRDRFARPKALKSCVKPTNVWSNCFSAVNDLQTIGFGVCEVYADFSARRMRVWRESATADSYHAPFWH